MLDDLERIVGCAYYSNIGFFIYFNNKDKSTKSFKIQIEAMKHCAFIKLKFCIGKDFVRRCDICMCDCNSIIEDINKNIIYYGESYD